MVHSMQRPARGVLRLLSEIGPYLNRGGKPRQFGNVRGRAMRSAVQSTAGGRRISMGERTGETWWGREAADLPEGEQAGPVARGEGRRGRGLTGPLALAISGLVLYLAGCILWERSHPASPAASGLREGDTA